MHTKAYRISLTITAIIIIIACASAVYYISKKENTSKRSIIKESAFMYYLKEYDEKIGVYNADENVPFMTLDVYVETLPYVDQVAINKGIKVLNDEKLKILIEDYES